MPIYPLPQFEDDLKAQEEERRAIEALKAPTSIVVRFGLMGLIGEYPYRGDATPGCGSKIVIRTHRGLEVGDMLTVTCPNAGCSTSVTREQMLEYIDNSGGRQYPFFTNGRALRVASVEDLQRQQKLDEQRKPRRDEARIVATNLRIPVKIIEVEPILSGDRVTIYYSCDDRVDTRPLTQELASRWKVRIDTRQVGARDEARLVADYERCGEYCCCKNFLKVLKPISMKAAKTQKATLDPLKISGRCGRLMCCLRYEDETYDELKKNLPHRKTHVGTPEGDGIVIDSQILTQLVLVRLDDGTKQIAVPVEHLTEPGLAPKKPEPPKRETSPRDRSKRTDEPDRPRRKRRRRKPRTGGVAPTTPESGNATQDAPAGPSESTGESADRPRRKRRRRRSASSPDAASSPDSTQPPGDRPDTPAAGPSESGEAPRKKRRRRRRRRRPGSEGSGPDSSTPPSNPGNAD